VTRLCYPITAESPNRAAQQEVNLMTKSQRAKRATSQVSHD